MTFSKMQLDAIAEAQVGKLVIARHPSKPIVLLVVEGTAVVVGMTIEQVDSVIDTLTIYRDRIVHDQQARVPFKSTPVPSVN